MGAWNWERGRMYPRGSGVGGIGGGGCVRGELCREMSIRAGEEDVRGEERCGPKQRQRWGQMISCGGLTGRRSKCKSGAEGTEGDGGEMGRDDWVQTVGEKWKVWR